VTGPDLRKQVGAALDRAVAGTGGPALAPARAALGELGARFGEPMRVAIVGRVSSGKSTLANALLGSRVVPTGVEELTYNVNWLRYDTSPSLVVHFKDPGRPPEPRDLASLEQLTARSDRFRAFLAEVDYLVISYPYPYLTAFDLIDTPGLDSHFNDDSANTLRFLGLSDDDVWAATVAHAARADALVMVFSRGAARLEADLLRDFQGADPAAPAISPISSVGVLTKIEQFWDPEDEPDPRRTGRRLAGRLMTEGGAGRHLYDIFPLASLVGEAAGTLDEADFADLAELAAASRLVLEDRLTFGPGFSAACDELPLPSARRAALFSRLSAYGIALACELIRDGVDAVAGLREELDARSGLAAFRESLAGHFGRRADLIKLQLLASHARAIPDRLGGLPPGDRAALDSAVAEITQLKFKVHAFSEIEVLRSFYDGALALSEADAADLRRVTGECGESVAARLGLPETATAGDLRDRARAGHARWSALAVEPLPELTHFAARTLRRSYEHLLHELGGGSAERGAP
jgi:hypothetical protein